MAAKRSAGLLVYRRTPRGLEVLLVHPGGPLWAKKDAGAWSIPKGGIDPGENELAAAQREFSEETGFQIACPERVEGAGPFTPLKPITQAGGKIVVAWAVSGDFDLAKLKSIEFEMEWPPRSGRKQMFPEIDRAAWLTLPEAREKILPGQTALLDELESLLK